MSSLIMHTILFVATNVLVAVLLLTGMGVTTTYTSMSVPLDGNDTEVSYGDIDGIGDYKVDKSNFDNAGIPAWFTWAFLLVDGIWLIALFLGWLRGVG